MANKKENKRKQIPDFLPEWLPSSRGKQFFDIVKNEWRTLLLIGLILSLFFLPFIISNIVEAGFMNGSANALREEMEAKGRGSEEILMAIRTQTTTIHLLFTAINILCFMIFSIGLAGASRIVKCLCFGEGVLFRSDFFIGIKKYWKAFLLIGFFAGLFYFLITYVTAMLNPMSQDNGGLGVLSGLTIGLYYAVIVPMLLLSMAQATLYDMPLFKSLSNSLRFLIVRYYIAAIFALTIYAISLLTMIVYPLIVILAFLAVIVLLLPFLVLSFHLFALGLFDKYINKDHYPHIYRKGLCVRKGDDYPPKDESETDISYGD